MSAPTMSITTFTRPYTACTQANYDAATPWKRPQTFDMCSCGLRRHLASVGCCP